MVVDKEANQWSVVLAENKRINTRRQPRHMAPPGNTAEIVELGHVLQSLIIFGCMVLVQKVVKNKTGVNISITSLLLLVVCYTATPDVPEYMLNSFIHV